MIVPGHRADVGAPVAADLGLVPHAADRHADEPASEGAGDRLAERGLADARRPDEAEDLARDLLAQLRDREVLDDPVLHLVEVEVIAVEHPPRVVQVEVVLGRGVPRQGQDPLEVGADDAVLGRGRRQPLEPGELAGRRLQDVLGQREALEPLPQLGDLRLLRVALAELLLDRLQLLAQEVLPLALLHLGLHLRLDLRAELEHLQLAREDGRDVAQALPDVDRLEQLLALLGRDRPQRRGDEMRERARVVDVRRRQLQLLGQVRRQRDDLREQVLHVPGQRSDLGRVGGLVRSSSKRPIRYGSSAIRCTRRIRCSPPTRMRRVPSGTLIILWMTAAVPTS